MSRTPAWRAFPHSEYAFRLLKSDFVERGPKAFYVYRGHLPNAIEQNVAISTRTLLVKKPASKSHMAPIERANDFNPPA